MEKQRIVGRNVYKMLRDYFESMVAFIEESKPLKSGLWGEELMRRLGVEARKDIYRPLGCKGGKPGDVCCLVLIKK